ncbi:hypothetical protein [Scytonema sp. PRP1]
MEKATLFRGLRASREKSELWMSNVQGLWLLRLLDILVATHSQN